MIADQMAADYGRRTQMSMRPNVIKMSLIYFTGQRISNSLSLTLSSRPVSIWLLSYAMNIPGTFGTYSSSPELGHIF